MDPSLQISRTANRALEVFSDEFRGGLVLATDVPLWARDFGLMNTADAISTTYPINIDAVGYHEFRGEHKYRHLYHRVLRMRNRTWQDGVEITAEELEAPEFTGWNEQPAMMADAWSRLPNKLVATMLESGSGTGPVLDFYTDPDTNVAGSRTLFASDHPANVLKPGVNTFDNDFSVSVAQIQNGDAWDIIDDYFGGIKAANGEPLGLSYLNGGHNLIPRTRTALFKKALEQDTLVRAVNTSGTAGATSSVVAAVTQNNIYKGLGYTPINDFTNGDVFYAVAAPKPGCHIWVVQQESSPEEVTFDTNSEEYKKTRKVKKSFVGRANCAAALPHRIARITIT